MLWSLVYTSHFVRNPNSPLPLSLTSRSSYTTYSFSSSNSYWYFFAISLDILNSLSRQHPALMAQTHKFKPQLKQKETAIVITFKWSFWLMPLALAFSLVILFLHWGFLSCCCFSSSSLNACSSALDFLKCCLFLNTFNCLFFSSLVISLPNKWYHKHLT